MKKSNVFEIVIAFLLTFSGGFVDVYTLVYREGLFANMQTGNLVKFCIALVNGSFELMYFLPIISFCVGCVLATLLGKTKIHKLIVLPTLFVLYLIPGFLPKETIWNIACVCVLSFAGALQFELFRECLKISYTNTMCTNNMRLFSENIANWNKKAIFFLFIILSFAFGCVISALIGKVMNTYSVSVISSIYLLVLVFTLLTKKDN